MFLHLSIQQLIYRSSVANAKLYNMLCSQVIWGQEGSKALKEKVTMDLQDHLDIQVCKKLISSNVFTQRQYISNPFWLLSCKNASGLFLVLHFQLEMCKDPVCNKIVLLVTA